MRIDILALFAGPAKTVVMQGSGEWWDKPWESGIFKESVILRNQHSVLSISSVLEGEYGLSGVSLGVPCIVSQEGIERVLRVALPPDEQSALEKSAAVLHEAIEKLGLTVAPSIKPSKK